MTFLPCNTHICYILATALTRILPARLGSVLMAISKTIDLIFITIPVQQMTPKTTTRKATTTTTMMITTTKTRRTIRLKRNSARCSVS